MRKKPAFRLAAPCLWLILLLAALALLSSCTPAGTGDVTTAAPAGDTTAAPSTEFAVVRDGVSVCTIIRPDIAEEAVKDAAVHIRKKVGEYTGVEPDIKTDYLAGGATPDPEAYEILFGLTNRQESIDACAAFSTYSQYSIAVVGNKLVVAASDANGYNRAASRLSYILSESVSGNNLVFDAARAESDVSDQMLASVPVYTDGKFETFLDCGDNASMYIYRSATAEGFGSYLSDSTFTDGGYTLYAENKIGDNSYATLQNGKYVVTAFYIPAERRTRIIVEPIANAYMPTESELTYTSKHVTTLTQVGLEYVYGNQVLQDYQIGLCYLYKLADGSFIVLDGGPSRTQDAERLLSNLRLLADDPKNIRIAAWILTHAHGDHVGTLRMLANMSPSSVTVEYFMLNFPAAATYESCGDGYPLSVFSAMKAFRGAKVIKVHPGQKFKVRNAEIEFYYTPDLLAPAACDTGNTLSLVFSITAEGQKVMFLGDESTTVSGIIEKDYGTALKSDMVQVSHHGASGGTVALYKLIDAKVALWPLGVWDYWYFGGHGRMNETWNAYLFDSPNMEEIILAGHSVRTLTLPYKTEGTIPKRPVNDGN